VRRPPAALTLALLALAGCGGGNGESGRTSTVQAAKGVDVVGREYSFDPTTVVVQGAGGKPIGIRLENEGSLAHNLKLLKDGVEVGGTTTFQGGQTRSASVSLKPGSYRMVCTVGNHEQLGMHGKLEVR
jgi:plastocyanin